MDPSCLLTILLVTVVYPLPLLYLDNTPVRVELQLIITHYYILTCCVGGTALSMCHPQDQQSRVWDWVQGWFLVFLSWQLPP